MEHNILILIVVRFVAHAIDGALEMAYGVSSTSFLPSIGISPAAKILTTGVSGLSHLKLGNLNDARTRSSIPM